MRKVIFAFCLLCSLASAADFGGAGVMFFAPGTTTVVESGGAGLVWDDDFSASVIATETWGVSGRYSTTITQTGDGWLRMLIAGTNGLGGDFKPAGVFRNIAGDFTAICKMNYAPGGNTLCAGIMAASPDCKAYSTVYKYYQDSEYISRQDIVDGAISNSPSDALFPDDDFYLKLTRSGTTLSTYHSTNGSDWTQLSCSSPYAPDASNSVLLWLWTMRTGGASPATASFDYCDVTRP